MTTEKMVKKINNLINIIEKIGSKWWGMLLLSIIPFLVVLFPFLFCKQIFFGGDLIGYHYPTYFFYKSSLSVGQSFLWNPNIFSGFPNFLSSMTFFSPLYFVLFKLFSLFSAYNIVIFLDLTLGLFFTWLFLKKMNLSFWTSFTGGLVFVFSQWFYLPNTTISNALPFLPLLFLIILQFRKEKSNSTSGRHVSGLWFILLLGLLIGWGWLSVHFSWLIMALSAGFIFSVYLAWLEKKWQIPPKFLVGCVIGILIGLPVVLPLFKYSALSSRVAGLSYKQSLAGMLGLGDFLRYFLPYTKLTILNLAVSPAQLYLGILPLFFLIFSFHKKFRTCFSNFFLFLFALCFLLSIGYSPLFWLLHKLPVFNLFRGPARWMFISCFSAAFLIGSGIDAFLKQNSDKWKQLLLKIFKWLSNLILLASVIVGFIFYFLKNKLIIFAQNYFNQNIYAKTSGLPKEHYYQVISKIISEIEQSFSIFSLRVFLPIIFIFISYFILIYFVKKATKKNFLPLIALVVFLNFWIVLMPWHSVISRDVFSQQPKTVEFIQQDIQQLEPLQGKRIFPLLVGFSEYNKLTVPYNPKSNEIFTFQSEMIVSNLNIFYGLSSADYYDNLMSRPMSRLIALIGSDQATIGDKLTQLKATPQEKIEIFERRKKILDILGIRYIISVYPLNELLFSKAFTTFVPPYNIPVNVYINKEARPLIYFAGQVETIKSDEEQAYQKFLQTSFQERNVFIECSDCPIDLENNGQSDIILEKKENSLVKIKTQSENNQILVFSENFLPGWKAYLDGNEIEIYRANSVYMSVYVPAGQHSITFEFNPYQL